MAHTNFGVVASPALLSGIALVWNIAGHGGDRSTLALKPMRSPTSKIRVSMTSQNGLSESFVALRDDTAS